MPSPKHWLFLLLLNVLQFALSVDAKSGGKGKGSSSSNCYDENGVQIKCPNNKMTIIITVAVVIGVIVLALSIWFFIQHRSKKKSRKSLDTESKGIHDESEDSHSKVPLVSGETGYK